MNFSNKEDAKLYKQSSNHIASSIQLEITILLKRCVNKEAKKVLMDMLQQVSRIEPSDFNEDRFGNTLD
jgi:hypothetical protein